MKAYILQGHWHRVGIVIFVVAWIGLCMPVAFTQMEGRPQVEPAYVPTLTFAVASVRQSKVDVEAGWTMSGQFVPHTTHLRLLNWSIESILSMVYDGDQMVGAPHWPHPTLFVVEAKGDGEADAKMATLRAEQQWAEQQHMLQALLEERFKLKAHWETREGDIYNLVMAKNGSKLGATGSMPPSVDELKIFGDDPVPSFRQKNDGQGYDFVAHDCPISDLAGALTSQFGRPVIDKTGLTGKYDFVVKYKGRWDSDRKADDMDRMLPLDQAIQVQLGLRLESAKGPLKMLVIDHIEKPSGN